MKITITINDENLDFLAMEDALSFESAEELFGKMQRRYKKRVEMELDKGDVAAESKNEETF